VFPVLAHDRRRILHFNVTAHPTAEWTGQQLREAFPFDQLLRYLLRDRDRIFGDDFREQVRDMGVVFFGGREGPTGQQKTAGVIRDGQRIVVRMIAQQELSLVIGAPQFIGSRT
jgi:hypothetical protein